MNEWEPPRIRSEHEVPLRSVGPAESRWRRIYRKLPVWGWAAGAVVTAVALAGALGQTGDPADPPAPEVAAAPNTLPTDTTEAPTTDPTTTPATADSSDRSSPSTSTTVATTTVATVAPATSAPIVVTLPTTTVVVTSPATTTTVPPPPPPPPPTAAATTTVAVLPFVPTATCDPNYEGACVPIASDVDCAGGSGNGPEYVAGPVYVVGSDIYDLDRDGDGDGVACER